MKRHLLVLCHDVIDAHFDRRISQQVNVWIEQGWDVTIVGMTDKDSDVFERWRNGVLCIKIDQRNLLPVNDALWEQVAALPVQSSGSAEADTVAPATSKGGVETSSPTIQKRLSHVVRTLWKRLPTSWRDRAWPWRVRLAHFVERWGKQPPAIADVPKISELEWYPLPFTESLCATAGNLRPDAILACDLTTIPAALRLATNTGAVLLYDAHEFYPEQAAFTPRQRALLRTWEARALNEAFLAYTVSPTIACLMQEQYQSSRLPDTLTNAPNFLARPPDTQRNGPIRRALNLETSTRLILYHGGFSKHRNLDVLIFGFMQAKLPNTCLVMLGFGDREWIKDLITQANGEGAVCLLNAVPASELDQWVADADFVVIPYPAVDRNTEFCSPNKLHDCVALEIPVLANQDLKDVCAVLSKYRIGISLDLSSPDVAARSLSNITAFQVNLSDFAGARRDLGWPRQADKVCSWIAAVEREIARGDQSKAPIVSPPSNDTHEHVETMRVAVTSDQENAHYGPPADSALYEQCEIWEQPPTVGRLRLIDALTLAWPQDATVALDVGCGDGKLSAALRGRTGAEIVGIDFSSEGLRRATLPVALADVSALPFRQHTFDFVLSVDVIEHLESDAETRALAEIFSVARQHVAIAVPYRENLPGAFARCRRCDNIYHVNWHQRSYAAESLMRRVPEGWVLAGLILSGESWIQTPPIVMDWMAAARGEWAHWSAAICPRCGQPDSPTQPESRVPDKQDALQLAASIYQDIATNGPRSANHTEILGLFARDRKAALRWVELIDRRLVDSGTLVQVTDIPANAVILPQDFGTLGSMLVQFPQVARRVLDIDGNFVIQAPVFGVVDQILLDFPAEIDEVHRFIIEDGLGLVTQIDLAVGTRRSIALALPRPLQAGLYGVIVRIYPNAPGLRVQVGGVPAPTVPWVMSGGRFSYLPMQKYVEASVWNQIGEDMWLGRDQCDMTLPHHSLSAKQMQVLAEAMRELPAEGQWDRFVRMRAKMMSGAPATASDPTPPEVSPSGPISSETLP
jgi:SAM-dependent methyltransferase/glycosyltransferase involved in cell wall biosynthesis